MPVGDGPARRGCGGDVAQHEALVSLKTLQLLGCKLLTKLPEISGLTARCMSHWDMIV